MAKRLTAEPLACVRNDVLAPPPGEQPIYELVLSDDDVEKLAQGRVSCDLMEQAYAMLSWKRNELQEWASYECTCGRPSCRSNKTK